MKYDFDKQINRRNTNSYKWNIAENELPMWVADMDFEVALDIINALEKKVADHVFGYQTIPDEWYDAYQTWWKTRHHIEFEKDSLIFCTGVVPAISSAVRKLTTPAEKVLIMTPVYNIFFNSILNNGRQVLESQLRYINGKYEIDFEDFEKKLADPQTSLFILCNPHNPVGRIWDKQTLNRIGELCDKHHVIVFSDEIHCDLTDPGKDYTPFASVSDICKNNCVTAIAPTKTFNIAGIQTAAVMVPNPVLRHKMWRALNTDEVAEPNVFSVPATVAAFKYGGEWLDQLREYIYQNKMYVADYIKTSLPKLRLVESEATYLLWIDCREYTNASDCLCSRIRELTGLFLSKGTAYGGDGRYFVRMNIACPKANVIDAMNRLKSALDSMNSLQ